MHSSSGGGGGGSGAAGGVGVVAQWASSCAARWRCLVSVPLLLQANSVLKLLACAAGDATVGKSALTQMFHSKGAPVNSGRSAASSHVPNRCR